MKTEELFHIKGNLRDMTINAMFPPGFDPEPEKDTTGTTGEI